MSIASILSLAGKDGLCRRKDGGDCSYTILQQVRTIFEAEQVAQFMQDKVDILFAKQSKGYVEDPDDLILYKPPPPDPDAEKDRHAGL